MKNIYLYPVFLSIIVACTKQVDTSNSISKVNETTADSVIIKQIENTVVTIQSPILIDSIQNILMYCLEEEGQNQVTSYTKSGRYKENILWNIAFYNFETKEQYLLHDKKMKIKQYYYNHNISKESNEVKDIPGKFIMYSVISKDYNNDNKLDDKDLVYLYISDRNGKNFRQITPENFHVQEWSRLKGTSKLLIKTLVKPDPNKEIVSSEEEVIPMIFDFEKAEMAQPVLNKKLTTEIKNQFYKYWSVK